MTTRARVPSPPAVVHDPTDGSRPTNSLLFVSDCESTGPYFADVLGDALAVLPSVDPLGRVVALDAPSRVGRVPASAAAAFGTGAGAAAAAEGVRLLAQHPIQRLGHQRHRVVHQRRLSLFF